MKKKKKMELMDFEAREVFKRRELTAERMSPTGYEAFRVSPRKTKKYGKEYRRIYGATVSPDYSRGKKGKYGAKVEWYPHGYAVPSVKPGTRLLQSLSGYPVDQTEARRKLMLEPRKRKKKR